MKIGKFAVFVSLLAVAAGAQAGIVAGQWLQINFTDGWNPRLRNWNYMADFPNPSFNATTGNSSSMIDSEGDLVGGVSLSASGWMGAAWSGGAVWGGNGIENDPLYLSAPLSRMFPG